MTTPEYLYVHVPFCVRRCSYCDFAVTVSREPPVDAWLDSVMRELDGVMRTRGWDRLRLKTVYIGGGTPSLLGTGALGAFADRLAERADLVPDVEWTAEANPESLTAQLAADWRAAGVNRISLGVQTFHEPALRWMGRMHGPEGARAAVAAARRGGLENFSVDLIFGLPARLGRDWGDDLERAIALEPAHVSLYGLTAEQDTPLGRWVQAGQDRLADDDRYAEEYLLAVERLGGAGFEHYEVSNFARPGKRSRHNSAYWTGEPWIGLGAGAHSYANGERWWNERDWARYRTRVLETGSASTGAERPETGDGALERAWLMLRTDSGVAPSELAPGQQALLAQWLRQGWAVPAGERVRLTAEGWLLLDRLAVELDGAA